MKVRLTIGDWSGDGHSISEDFIYESNKSVEEIRQAYKNACKLTGLSFNHNDDYTGLNLGYGTDRQIATEYEESTISKLALKILKKHGIELKSEDGSEEYFIDGSEDFVDILIKFIKLSLPDLKLKEASYKKSELKDIPAINGWWNKELNCQFGYGLFE